MVITDYWRCNAIHHFIARAEANTVLVAVTVVERGGFVLSKQ